MTNELKTLLMRGTGRWPTSYLLRWRPTFKKPFQFDLLEVMRCETDGEIVTRKLSQSPRAALHAGHKVKNPQRYSFFEWIQVQVGLIV